MAIALVQSKPVASGSGTTSATATGHAYASNTAAGNLLVIIARSDASWSSGASAAPIIDLPSSSGFTWVQAATADYSDSTNQQSSRVSIFYIANAGSMASSLNASVTATRANADSTDVSFTAYEFSGVNTSSPLDTSVEAFSQTSTPISAGSLVTAGTALILAACIAEAPTVSTGAGFTAGPNTSEQYILNQVSGTISTAFGGNTGTDKWGA